MSVAEKSERIIRRRFAGSHARAGICKTCGNSSISFDVQNEDEVGFTQGSWILRAIWCPQFAVFALYISDRGLSRLGHRAVHDQVLAEDGIDLRSVPVSA